jgi:hypothetical protein
MVNVVEEREVGEEKDGKEGKVHAKRAVIVR